MDTKKYHPPKASVAVHSKVAVVLCDSLLKCLLPLLDWVLCLVFVLSVLSSFVIISLKKRG